jgi:hypothetical protein
MPRYAFFKQTAEPAKKGLIVPSTKYAFEYEDEVHYWKGEGLKIFCVQWNMAGKVWLKEWAKVPGGIQLLRHASEESELP